MLLLLVKKLFLLFHLKLKATFNFLVKFFFFDKKCKIQNKETVKCLKDKIISENKAQKIFNQVDF